MSFRFEAFCNFVIVLSRVRKLRGFPCFNVEDDEDGCGGDEARGNEEADGEDGDGNGGELDLDLLGNDKSGDGGVPRGVHDDDDVSCSRGDEEAVSR
jgi:hypothetical protein